MRFLHDLDPFILRIHGDFGIRWYSLPYLIGFILAYRALLRAEGPGGTRRFTAESVDRFVVHAIVGVLLGARFFHVFVFEFADYGFDPLAWIAVWRGGLSFHGGLVGAALALALFAAREGVSFYELSDRLVVPAAIALGFGRIGNFINAEMPGTPYDGPFCIDYSMNGHLARPPVGCRHPTQLYEMAKNWVIAVFLFVLGRRAPRPGVLSWGFVGLYGLIRFWLMFLRDEIDVWGPFTLSQLFSALMALVAAAALAWLLRPAAAPGVAPGR